MERSHDALASTPLVQVGRRFLPVPAAQYLVDPTRSDLVDLPVSPGTPVHAVQAGRVIAAEGTAVGEVVLRVAGDIRLHYRGLVPSSVTVGPGDSVSAGSVLGVVAAASAPGDTTAALRFGAEALDGSWLVVSELLAGLPDPAELLLSPPRAAASDLVARAPSQRSPGQREDPPPITASGRRPPGSHSPLPGPEGNADEPEDPAPEPVDDQDRVRRLSGRRRRPGARP